MLEQSDENIENTDNTSEENTTNAEETTIDTEEVTSEEKTETVVETEESANAKEVEAAVESVENEVAEDAEKVEEKTEEKVEIPVLEYDKMDFEALVSELKKTIKNNPINRIKTQVEGIKSAFNQQFGALLKEKKEAFLAEGGNSIDFQFSSPIKTEYNNLLSEYKTQRDKFYAELDKQLKDNLEKRNQVIADLKALIEEADTQTMYPKFRDLQNIWKSIGGIPKTKYNDTWKIYHHHVERFYDLLHISKDLRDLDFKNNLVEKTKLVEKAEKLTEAKDVNEAFKELQNLHKLWKEDIGPVAKESREEIWQRFSLATKTIHDKRHDYFREMKSKYQEIIDAKLLVIEKIDQYDSSKNATHNHWQKSIKDIESLRQEYFNAGKLPYSKSEEVWQKFKEATKKFNQAKNVFYKQEKSSQQDNLQKKIALIELAESLKDSDDWENTTNAMKKVQADWKRIGHVPRKFSDDIWKRFKAACNHYFDKFHENRNSLNAEQQEIVDTKKQLIEDLKDAKATTKEEVLALVSNWNAAGSLPRNARHLEGKFNKQIDKLLESLNLDKSEVVMLKFTNIVDGFVNNNDVRKLDSEKMFIRKKIDETVREMQQLENNLGFISNATEDNPLVKNVRDRVKGFKSELDVWQVKLDYLKRLKY
ncbi:uncharacterized protein DUF349 [Lutibacter sp. Hel_I_33_5]|uniref:DUF349 domain-containing protein n=1 Tax=Lutibacter sp. Hel_I_33_5 TaxID=1566289 RepID=UPI0011A5070B|nr:DUF349 domain-containing protein [Lutibacter sp. Hel_I_33_5]TVZ57166.1 uncharacterized protein DUF349 [Lutibacter sp. Hel_I_33_5]